MLLQLDAGGSGAAELPAVLPPAALAGLFREASVAASIQHPNVVSLVGVCSQPPALVSGERRNKERVRHGRGLKGPSGYLAQRPPAGHRAR